MAAPTKQQYIADVQKALSPPDIDKMPPQDYLDALDEIRETVQSFYDAFLEENPGLHT